MVLGRLEERTISGQFKIAQQHLDPGIQLLALSFMDALRRVPLRLPKLSRLELFTLRRARSP